MRMGGEEISKAFYAEGRLSEILSKTLEFDPKNRYTTPMQMRQELEAILYEKEDGALIYPDGDELKISENIYISKSRSIKEDIENQNDKTESVFDTVDIDKDISEEMTSGTESIFSNKNKNVTEKSFRKFSSDEIFLDDETSKTESVFKQRGKSSEKKSDQKKQKRVNKSYKLIIIGVIVGIVVVGIGFIVYRNNKIATYNSLLESASDLYVSDPNEAAELLLQAQTIFPKETEPYIRYAYALYCAKDYDNCIDYIENTLSLGKQYEIQEQSQLSEILGASYFEKGDYAAAASFFRLSTAGGDITVSAMRDYAVSLGRLGDIKAAEEVLQMMFDAGAEEIVTKYVKAEVDYAQSQYLAAEAGFKFVYENAEDDVLKIRAMRSLAEVYRDCAVLERTGQSPIYYASTSEAELLAEGIVSLGLRYDSTLWEMLGQAYTDAYHTNPSLDETWLVRSAECFEEVIELGILKEYLYINIYAAYYELGDYSKAEETLKEMEAVYSNSYIPHALRAIMLIQIESNKNENSRDYQDAYDEYQMAESKLNSADDKTYFQQVDSFIQSLRNNG